MIFLKKGCFDTPFCLDIPFLKYIMHFNRNELISGILCQFIMSVVASSIYFPAIYAVASDIALLYPVILLDAVIYCCYVQ